MRRKQDKEIRFAFILIIETLKMTKKSMKMDAGVNDPEKTWDSPSIKTSRDGEARGRAAWRTREELPYTQCLALPL